MGVRERMRAPISRDYFWTMILLACTSGLTLAAITQTLHRQQDNWLLLFVTAELILLGLYVSTVRLWVDWLYPERDYKYVCADVYCLDECDHDTGESRYP